MLGMLKLAVLVRSQKGFQYIFQQNNYYSGLYLYFFLNFFKENLAALYLLTLSAVPSLITYINSSIEYTCRIKSFSTKENRRYLALLALLLLTLSSSLLV